MNDSYQFNECEYSFVLILDCSASKKEYELNSEFQKK